jgi:hypothetical protein
MARRKFHHYWSLCFGTFPAVNLLGLFPFPPYKILNRGEGGFSGDSPLFTVMRFGFPVVEPKLPE